MITKERSRTDGRQSLLALTARGRNAFAPLDAHSNREVGRMLRPVPASEQTRLVTAMQQIEGLLAPQPERTGAYLLRPHRPGDMGWIVARHGVLYAEEYGWDEGREALVARLVAQFVQPSDPNREAGGTAPAGGETVGAGLLVKGTA